MMQSSKNHCSIFISRTSYVLKDLISQNVISEFVDISKLKGKVLNITVINDMIALESRRDTSVILEQDGQTLRSMSSGEQKKAVLKYFSQLELDYLILENAYDNLDENSRHWMEKTVVELSDSLSVIQVSNRSTEFIPLKQKGFYFKEDALIDVYEESRFDHFLDKIKEEGILFQGEIPEYSGKIASSFEEFVVLKDVNVSFFEKQVLKNINWEIKPGEFWQLKGPNGVGKTTLISLITGDSHKAYGQNIVLFDRLRGTGETIWDIKKNIGYFTPTISELFEKRHSVIQMIVSGFYDSIGLYRKPEDLHVHLAKKWLEVAGLSHLQSSTFSSLSNGLQKVIMVIRAMVKNPPLLILDEPTTGIDSESVQLIVSFVNKFAKETNTAVIYVSHRDEEGIDPDFVFELKV